MVCDSITNSQNVSNVNPNNKRDKFKSTQVTDAHFCRVVGDGRYSSWCGHLRLERKCWASKLWGYVS